MSTILQMVKSPYLNENKSDFDEIWYTTARWNSMAARRPSVNICLQFKVTDVRRFNSRFLAISRLPDFRGRGEAVFHRISAMGHITVIHRTYFFVFQCSLGFGERRLLYRLRYTCFLLLHRARLYSNKWSK